jgi:hypothetical protein
MPVPRELSEVHLKHRHLRHLKGDITHGYHDDRAYDDRSS